MESQHEAKLHLLDQIKSTFETLLNDVFNADYKNKDGYEIRITENISAQLIEDVHESIDRLNCVIKDLEAEDV